MWTYGLISSVNMSSLTALAMAWSSRVATVVMSRATPFEHAQRVVSVGYGGNTADQIKLAKRDLAISVQLQDIGQEHGCSGLLSGCVLLYFFLPGFCCPALWAAG